MGNRISDVLETIQNNLNQKSEYQDVYDIGLATGLVKKKNQFLIKYTNKKYSYTNF